LDAALAAFVGLLNPLDGSGFALGGLGVAVCLLAVGLGFGVLGSRRGLFAVGNLPGAWVKALGVAVCL